MPRLGDYIGKPSDAEEPAEQQLWEGRVANTPAFNGDEVFVTIPSFDEEAHRFGPVVWSPKELKGEELMPSKGDICLIAKPSVQGSVWLLEWR